MEQYQIELLKVAEVIYNKIPVERRPSIWDVCKDLEGIVNIVLEGRM